MYVGCKESESFQDFSNTCVIYHKKTQKDGNRNDECCEEGSCLISNQSYPIYTENQLAITKNSYE